ncbi:MAG: class I SAM-dependent methyltransferase [Phycisphaerae bacterium]
MQRVPINETRFGRIFQDAELSADYARRHAAAARRAGEQFAEFLNRAGCAPTRVLDVGSGSGDTLLALADRLPAAELVGVDLCPTLLDISRRKAAECGVESRVQFQEASALALPFGDASFDAIFSQDTLHMVDDPVRMLDECARVLRPGGVALVRVVRRSRLLALIEGILRSGFTRDEVAALLGRSAFERFDVRGGLLYVTVEAHRQAPAGATNA